MKHNPAHSKRQHKQAFTLLELLVAMVIMTIAMSIAFQAFSGTIRGWKRGMEVIDGIKHGDFAMNQLSATLNSTIYFFNQRKTYAFKIEKGSGSGLPNDMLSFVTSSGAFMPPDSAFTAGPHRIKLYIDDDERGNPALYALAMPAIADDEEFEDEYDTEPVLVSRAIQGLEILFWDTESEDWTEEWEKENSVPERILLTVFVDSQDEDEEPIEFSRVIEIPVFKSVASKLSGPSKANNNQSQQPTGGAAPRSSGGAAPRSSGSSGPSIGPPR